jgi:hypothetical protein
MSYIRFLGVYKVLKRSDTTCTHPCTHPPITCTHHPITCTHHSIICTHHTHHLQVFVQVNNFCEYFTFIPISIKSYAAQRTPKWIRLGINVWKHADSECTWTNFTRKILAILLLLGFYFIHSLTCSYFVSILMLHFHAPHARTHAPRTGCTAKSMRRI